MSRISTNSIQVEIRLEGSEVLKVVLVVTFMSKAVLVKVETRSATYSKSLQTSSVRDKDSNSDKHRRVPKGKTYQFQSRSIF